MHKVLVRAGPVPVYEWRDVPPDWAADLRPRVPPTAAGEAVAAIQVVVGGPLSPARGIGDHILGLTAAEGLRRDDPTRRVIYCVNPQVPHCLAWCRLFGGYDDLTLGAIPDIPVVYPHDTYAAQVRDRLRSRSRWRHYADACNTRAALPSIQQLPGEAVAWARRYRGCVALSPWVASDDARRWSTERWLALAEFMTAAGLRPVVLDDVMGRSNLFPCEVVASQSPTHVAALMLEAALVVGNDSGMCHVSGMLGVPTLVLCEAFPGPQIFGFYPLARSIDGRLIDITPQDVLAEVVAMVQRRDAALRQSLPREADIHAHSLEERAHLYRALDGGSIEEEPAELLAALVHCYKPELVLETGTFQGHSARVLAEACRRNNFGRVITLEADTERASKASAALADLRQVSVIRTDSVTWLRAYNGPPFGLIVLDTDVAVRVQELAVIRERGLALGPVFVHDTSRLRSLTVPDRPTYPTELDALGLPGVECPLSRGWRLFDLGRPGRPGT
jgi:predicted O-methyltransferase YrrM